MRRLSSKKRTSQSRPAGLSREYGAAALNADRADLGCFVKGHQSQMNRQRQSINVDGSSKCVGLIVALAEDHQVNVRRIRLVPVDRAEKMPQGSFGLRSKRDSKLAKAGDYVLANHLASHPINSRNDKACAPIDLAAASAWLVIAP